MSECKMLHQSQSIVPQYLPILVMQWVSGMCRENCQHQLAFRVFELSSYGISRHYPQFHTDPLSDWT